MGMGSEQIPWTEVGGTAPSGALPRVVRFLETVDAPGSSCPHCGATGRFILRFLVEDGRTLAAMRGCAKLFPVSRVAVEEQRLREKLARYRKAYGAGASLNRADTFALDAVESFYAGTCDEAHALRAVDSAKRANTARYRR